MSRPAKGVVFNCFSPPVMLATLTIEFSLAAYSLWRYKLNELTKLAVIMLGALGTFQLAEYFVCTGYGLRAEQWSRVGFIAISALPPIGIHIMHRLANKPVGKIVWGSYGIMAGFMALFMTYKTAFIGHVCTGNYVIFQLGQTVGGAYSIYYFGLLAIGISLGLVWASELKLKGASVVDRLQAVRGLIVGYLVFLVPTALALTFRPQSRQGIPSIMCGFAVIFALLLGLYILPKVAVARDVRKLSIS